MSTPIATVIHLFVGALWTGSTIFFGLSVVPADGEAAGDLVGRFTMLSRGSSLVMLLSGGYMAMALPAGSFRGTGEGTAVLVMIVLWLVLTALLEVGNARVSGGTVGRSAGRYFQAGAVVAALLLVDAGLLAANVL